MARRTGKYEAVVREQVIPDIEARRIPGCFYIDLLRYELEDQVVFVTLMWFDDLSSAGVHGRGLHAQPRPERREGRAVAMSSLQRALFDASPNATGEAGWGS